MVPTPYLDRESHTIFRLLFARNTLASPNVTGCSNPNNHIYIHALRLYVERAAEYNTACGNTPHIGLLMLLTSRRSAAFAPLSKLKKRTGHDSTGSTHR
jgi:hypothetical protein